MAETTLRIARVRGHHPPSNQTGTAGKGIRVSVSRRENKWTWKRNRYNAFRDDGKSCCFSGNVFLGRFRGNAPRARLRCGNKEG